MNTLEDLKEYIKTVYNVNPVVFDGKILTYRAITFERNESPYIYVNKQKMSDMWTVKRNGHSIDFFRTSELKEAVSPGGSLLYYFMPEIKV
jgi:hypothetical protein